MMGSRNRRRQLIGSPQYCQIYICLVALLQFSILLILTTHCGKITRKTSGSLEPMKQAQSTSTYELDTLKSMGVYTSNVQVEPTC